jgi:hypothetical protein
MSEARARSKADALLKEALSEAQLNALYAQGRGKPIFEA